MYLKPIKTLQDFNEITERAECLADRISASPAPMKTDSDELDILVAQIEIFERENWVISYKDSIQALFEYADYWGDSRDLSDIFNSPTLAQNILTKKQPLTLPLIYKICKEWKIPAQFFLSNHLL